MEASNEVAEVSGPVIKTLDREARSKAIGRQLTLLKDKNEAMNIRSSVYIAESGIATKPECEASADSLDDVDTEMLTAEFRHQLGLLPEEDQELTTLFKARIGLSHVDENVIEQLSKDRKKVMKQYPFEHFMHRYFLHHTDDTSKLTSSAPILPKEEKNDILASKFISIAIRKYVFEDYEKVKSPKSPKIFRPVMIDVYRLLDPRLQEQLQDACIQEKQKSLKAQNSRTYSLKKLLSTIGKSSSRRTDSGRGTHRSNSVTEEAISYDEVISRLTSDLDLIHFIISHGILRKQLRDEIFSQLCLESLKTSSVEVKERVWVLHMLTAACFLPSSQMIGYYFGFLHENSTTSEYAEKVMQVQARTNANGQRYHPPNYIELKAAQLKRQARFEVSLVDGRSISVEVDSAVSSQEICHKICAILNIQDYFGFSLYISNFEKVSSLGCGSDHVMDAVTECEHMGRERGLSEGGAPWCLFFRKEVFTPWYDPAEDVVATRLIYEQAKLSIIKDELNVLEEVLPSMLAQSLFVEYGYLTSSVIKEKLSLLLSESQGKNIDSISNLVVKAAIRMSLDSTSLTKDEIMQHYVANVAHFCALSFSALFEAYPTVSINLTQEDIVVAVNSLGIALLDRSLSRILVNLNFCEIVDIHSTGTADIATGTFTLTLLDGNRMQIYSPNAEVITRIVSVFLAGLRRRSRWAVAIKTIIIPNEETTNRLDLQVGDTVELLNEREANLPSAEWLIGRCERSAKIGAFPPDSVYIIPTPTRPIQEFVDMLKQRGQLAQLDPANNALKTFVMSETTSCSRLQQSIV